MNPISGYIEWNRLPHIKKVRESSFNRLNSLTFYEPKAGLEPATYSLRMSYSTNWVISALSLTLSWKSDANLLLSLKLQNEFGIFFHSTGVFYSFLLRQQALAEQINSNIPSLKQILFLNAFFFIFLINITFIIHFKGISA